MKTVEALRGTTDLPLPLGCCATAFNCEAVCSPSTEGSETRLDPIEDLGRKKRSSLEDREKFRDRCGMRLWELLVDRLGQLEREARSALDGEEECLFDAHSSDSESSHGSVVAMVPAVAVGRWLKGKLP